jgi:hypothetical protein
VWRDGFLNMNPYWGKEPGSGREKNYIPKIVGRIVYRASGSAPIESEDGSAPVFGGYRIVEGSPEFWYRVGKDTVRERVVPGPEGGFELRVHVEGSPRAWRVAPGESSLVRVSPVGKQNDFVVRFVDKALDASPGVQKIP